MNIKSPAYSGEEEAEYAFLEEGIFSSHKLVVGLVLLASISVLIVCMTHWMMNPSTLPIKSVRVEGEFLHLSTDVLRNSVIDVVRDGFFNVNVDLIQTTLFSSPWVDEVTVRRVWPDGLVVRVVEKKVIARWGDRGLVSPEADLFFPERVSIPDGLPLFNGPDNTQALILNRYLQINGELVRRGWSVAGVTLDKRWSWSFSLESGTRVLLGRRDVSARILRFSDLAATEIGKRQEDIDVIDMRYTNGFAVRWKSQHENKVESELNNHG